MRILGLDKRKTSAKFYGNHPTNPTEIFININYGRNGVYGFVELTERYVYQIKLQYDRPVMYKGLNLHCKDFDRHSTEDIVLTETVIADMFKMILTGDVIIEDGCYIVNFILNKAGNRYIMELLTHNEVQELIRNS